MSSQRKKKKVKEDPPYDYVFIGAGAATAYYIQGNKEALKGKRVLIIGPDQPWANERGPGNINHPMAQIVPNQAPEGGQGLAKRMDEGSFSEWVERVLSRTERKTEKVSKKPQMSYDGYYRIYFESNTEAPVKAKHVILAIGIGPHRKPEGYDAIPQENKGFDKTLSLPRVMSLDEFQGSIPQIKEAFNNFNESKKENPVMILVGPNAGIDAATTYARQLTDVATLKWIAKPMNDIPFLKGTDNAKGKDLAKTLDNNLITSRFIKVEIDVNKVVAKIDKNQEVKGELLVYALGPEPNFLDQFLPEGQEAKDLEPIYDRNNRISSARDQVDSGSQLDTGTLFDRIKNWALNELKRQHPEKEKEKLGAMINESEIKNLKDIYAKMIPKKTNNAAPDFGRKSLPKNSMEVGVVGLQVPKEGENDPTFQVLGGSAYRLAEKVTYKHHSESISRIIEEAATSKTHQNKTLIDTARGILTGIQKIEDYAEEVFTKLTSRVEKEKKEGEDMQTNKLKPEIEALKVLKDKLQKEMKEEEQRNQSNAFPFKTNTVGILSPIPRYIESLENSIHGFSSKNNPSNPLKASTHINEIAHTHPVNVALGDQLTSVMSQVGVASEQKTSVKKEQEGRLGKDYINSAEYKKAESEFSEQRNLTVNDATDIAMFIASEYPAIPPVIANEITRYIIWDRRYGNPEDAVPSYDINADKADTTTQSDYQEKWKTSLAALHQSSLAIFKKQ